MKKRILAASLTAALLLSTMAGCGTESKPDTSKPDAGSTGTSSSQPSEKDAKVEQAKELNLYTYYADSGIQQVDGALKALKEIYPDLTINIEHRTDSDGSVLKTRASVGELPDFFECTGQLTDIFVKSGDIVPLDDTIDKTKFFDNFIENSFEGKKSEDGHYYAIGISNPNPCLMYYNKKVFADNGLTPPTNYPELLETVKVLKEKGLIPLSLFAQQKWPGLQMYDMAIVGNGESRGLTGLEDGSTKITDEAYVNAANKLYELVQAGLIGKGALNTNASQAFELLKMGQAGLLVNGSWYFNDAKEYGDNIGYLDMNPFAEPGKEAEVQWTMSGGAPEPGGYAVSAKGKYIDFSKEVLLNFVKERERVGIEEFGSVSRFKEAVEPKEPRYEAYQQFAENIGNIQSTTKYEWGLNDQELIVLLEDSTEKLLTGTYSPDEYIADVEKQISVIIG